MHPTLGILARFQAFFYALSFSQSDGVPPPAPARVTQTVETVEKVPKSKKSVSTHSVIYEETSNIIFFEFRFFDSLVSLPLAKHYRFVILSGYD